MKRCSLVWVLSSSTALVALSVCGSSSTTKAGATATTAGSSVHSSTTPSAATGAPIKVEIISTLKSSTFAFPEIQSMIDAKAKQVNMSGGIQGHQVQVIACNDQGDTSGAVAATCARQGVADGVVAVLAPYSYGAPTVTPILEAAHIAYVGNTITAPQDSTSPVAFPLNSGVPGNAAATVVQAGQIHCTRLGMVGTEGAGLSVATDVLTAGMKAQGGALVDTESVPVAGAADYSAQVSAIQARGAQCLFLFLPPTEAIKVASAVAQSGKHLTLMASTQVLPQQLVGALPASVTEGAKLSDTAYDPTDTNIPSVAQMLAVAKSYGVSDTDTHGSFAVDSWGAATILFNAMAHIKGPITAESVLQAMGDITDPGTDLFGSFTTTQQFPLQGFNRVFNTNELFFTVHNKTIELDSPNFVNVRSTILLVH